MGNRNLIHLRASAVQIRARQDSTNAVNTTTSFKPGSAITASARPVRGLWLDTEALVARDGAALLAKLQEGLQGREHAAFVEELTKRAG